MNFILHLNCPFGQTFYKYRTWVTNAEMGLIRWIRIWLWSRKASESSKNTFFLNPTLAVIGSGRFMVRQMEYSPRSNFSYFHAVFHENWPNNRFVPSLRNSGSDIDLINISLRWHMSSWSKNIRILKRLQIKKFVFFLQMF